MTGQGSTTRRVASVHKNLGWTIVFVCIPNTPHLDVIPIPTSSGSSAQRYPDVVAYRGNVTKLIEVEMRLDTGVAKGIQRRFGEAVAALSDPGVWAAWRGQIQRQNGCTLPAEFIPDCELVVCNYGASSKEEELTKALERHSIRVVPAARYG